MEISRCRLCLSESDFNVSLFGGYCRRTGMLDKILVCLRIVVEETDCLSTICFRCAGNVEKFHDFIAFVRTSQTKLASGHGQRQASLNTQVSPTSHVKCHVTSYVREQVFDADHTFSFLEVPKERHEAPSSYPFFSPLSLNNVPLKQSNDSLWKTPRPLRDERNSKRDDKFKRPCSKSGDVSPHCSRDLFTQSPDVEGDPKTLDWKLAPDDDIIKKVRERCFGLSDFYQ